jgi:putative peptidoglycan lipid II flippase
MAVQTRSLAHSTRLGRVFQSRQLITHIGVVALCSVGVKATGMLRDVVLASRFGTSDAADAFIAAWALPQFLGLIVGAAFAGVIIPLRAEAVKQGGEAYSRRFLSEMLLLCVVALASATVLLAPLRDLILPIVTSNFSPAKYEQTRDLFLIMLPAVFLYAMTAVWSAMLHTEERFGLAAAAPLLIPVSTVSAMWVYPQGGITSPAVGFVLGYLANVAALLWGLHRHELDILPRWHGGLRETRLASRQLLPFLANGVVFGGIGVVDQAMAATLGKGSLATLSYGNKVVLPILGIGSSAMSTVAYPRFARLVAEREWDRLRTQIKGFLGMILVATVPLVIAILVLSHWIVALLFERGEFTAADTRAVAEQQMIIALMIPAYAMGQLLSNVINSMQATRLMLIGSVFIAIFNLVADYFFKEWFGIKGIAVATVLNYLLALAINGYLVWRLIEHRRAEARGVT